MKNIIAVGVGGAVGSLLRYSMYSYNIHSFIPYGTLLANLIGSLLLGLLTGWYSSKKNKEWIRLGLGAGLCGGFTTMSTFSSEVVTLISQQSYLSAMIYVLVSMLGGLLLALFGIYVGSNNFFSSKADRFMEDEQ